MKLIYIAHPFNGERENKEAVGKIISDLVVQLPSYAFYSPIHATGFLYDKLDYMEGIGHCFEVLSRCDELWIYGDWENSRGCQMEYAFAKGKGIPVAFMDHKE